MLQSRGFQVSSEISFLISVRKTLPTSSQTIDVTSKNFRVCNYMTSEGVIRKQAGLRRRLDSSSAKQTYMSQRHHN